jgi:WD40 repeat protein
LEAHFSPDGRQLVTASADGTAILWDAATGLRQASLRPNAASNSIPDPLIQAYFSPDGQYVAAQTQSGKIHLWAATWEMLLKLARSRSLRQLTADECDRYLQLDSNQCPKLPL